MQKFLIPLSLLLISCSTEIEKVEKIEEMTESCLKEIKLGKIIKKERKYTPPKTLSLKLYPVNEDFHYPEEKIETYQTDIGLAISGGGFRAYSAAIGQISGLMKLKLFKEMGTLSIVSGSTWFSVPFNYAPETISESVLFGKTTVLAPAKLTVKSISEISKKSMGYPITTLSNEVISNAICMHCGEGYPEERLYSTILKNVISNFDLSDDEKFFTYDSSSASDLIKENPSLKMDNFYLMRKNRPYFVASATIFDTAFTVDPMHHTEFTPLYFGTKELFHKIRKNGDTVVLGGGYADIIGFNSKTPLDYKNSSAVVEFPPFSFTLFDMMGTSGAAPGSIFDNLKTYNLMSEYNYWPVDGPESESEFLSFVDGGDYENMALIPLLRRGFKNIISFDNSLTPLGAKKDAYKGVNYDVARLFGFRPEKSLVNKQNTQIFPSEEFAPLLKGLLASQKEGGLPYYIGEHEILQDNPFGIKSYKPGEKVRIIWVFNDLNRDWKEKLSPEVKALFTEENGLDNFPSYKTVLQNKPELLLLSPEQINLLANMWHFSVSDETQLAPILRNFVSSSKN